MGIHLGSVLLGFGAALVLPVASRVFRPFLVECLAAGMGALDEARRVVAEQVEVLEDIAAEARTKREAATADLNGESEPEGAGEELAEVARGRARRRPAAGRRVARPKDDGSES
jgi:hypothetical protein